MSERPTPEQMDRVRAARLILEGKDDEQAELDAFMAIFHPSHERIVLDSRRQGASHE